MTEFFTNVGLLASQNHFLAYFIIYFATIFLGNIASFAGFWLALSGSLGNWGVPLLMATICFSEITGDLLWYGLGRTLRDTNFGNFVKNHLPKHEKIEAALHKKKRFWIFISKYIFAASFPIIFMVGWARVDFKKFWRTSLLSIVTWVPFLSFLAFVLIAGVSPLGAVDAFKQIEKRFFISIMLFLVVDFVLSRGIAAMLRKRFREEEDPVA